MHSVDLNWVAIMVAAFIAYVGGAIWYSPVLFSNTWARLVNLSQEQMSSGAPIAMVVQAVVTVATAAVIAVVIAWSGANNIIEGIGVGVLLGVGLVVSDHAKLVAFERRSLRLFAINNGYTVLAFAVMGAIIALWP